MDNQQDLYREILERISTGVYFVNRERVITYWNKGAEQLSGYSAQEIVGKRCADFLRHVDEKGEVLCGSRCPLLQVMLDGVPRQAEVYMHHKMGHLVPILVQGVALEEDGGIKGAVEIFQDLSPLKMAQARIHELTDEVLLDQLTGVYNRRGLEVIITARLAEFKNLGAPFGIIFIDMDRFKYINDQYGHNIGDQILVELCSTLKRSVRESDAVGRWGGDELILVIQDVTQSSIDSVTEKISHTLISQSYLTDAGPLSISCSLGSTVPNVNDDLPSLVARADSQMYALKKKKLK